MKLRDQHTKQNHQTPTDIPSGLSSTEDIPRAAYGKKAVTDLPEGQPEGQLSVTQAGGDGSTKFHPTLHLLSTAVKDTIKLKTDDYSKKKRTSGDGDR